MKTAYHTVILALAALCTSAPISDSKSKHATIACCLQRYDAEMLRANMMKDVEISDLAKRQKPYFGTHHPTGVVDEEITPDSGISKRQKPYFVTHQPTGVVDEEITTD